MIGKSGGVATTAPHPISLPLPNLLTIAIAVIEFGPPFPIVAMPRAVDVADADAEVEEEAQAAVAVPPSDPAPVVSIASSSGKRKVVRPEYHTGTDVHAGVRSM